MRAFFLACLLGGSAVAADSDFFEAKVRPVLAANCYGCHTDTQMGGLRLDSAEGLRKGGKSGAPVVAGKPDDSLLIQAIRQTHPRLKMPPGGKLKPAEIEAIAEWVKAGAVWPTGPAPVVSKTPEYVITSQQRAFWSFQKVRKPAVPVVKSAARVQSPIDNFVFAKLEAQGLKPARPADKRILIRRATFDLTGLPPTAEEVDGFLADGSPGAFAKVVDRLLASPQYGERWGRYWLDVARYSDDKLNSTQEEPYPNAYRYRDWVIAAFNSDLPYDTFVKAQIAGDMLESKDPLQYLPALGYYSLSPEMQDERVDATTRGFLGLTVACAQCHDHKFDPIPQKDYYSLQGVFSSTELSKEPLAPKDVVDKWDAEKKALDKADAKLKEYVAAQTDQLGSILASQTARFLLASRGLGPADDLDRETLERWTKYLASSKKDHPNLARWFELAGRNAPREEFEAAAREFQAKVEDVNEEKHLVDDKNKIKLGLDPSRNDMSQADLFSLSIDNYNFWRDMFSDARSDAGGALKTSAGVYYYSGKQIDRFLSGEWKRQLDALRTTAADLKKALPAQYPFLQTIKDRNPRDLRVAIRGDVNNRGEVAPRHLPSILCEGAPKPFSNGSGRLELANGIADAENPLTARVIANRIWLHHFGQGIVETPSNFGNMGARPGNQELLDYLAASLVEHGWSIKQLHREIMLSSVYALSAEEIAANVAVDPDNRLLWRANWQRLDAETLRDSLLFVGGNMDLQAGGPPAHFDEKNRRRSVYGFISRRKMDSMLALFDFPNPNNTSEQRVVTNVPLQRLFMMNSAFVEDQASGLAKRLTGTDDERVRQAYRTLYGRAPNAQELQLALGFVKKNSWNEYARVLLNSNEFGWVN
ncbi:MAG: PSD1 and planctomycete cytochrome C domain-containing protein [Candidatus Solibacter sp.]